MSEYRLQTWQGADGQWYVRLIAPNGQYMVASEGYSTRSNARRAARRLKVAVYRAVVE